MPDLPAPALIYILPGIDPAALFTGSTLLDRASALALAAGFEALVVVANRTEGGRQDRSSVVRPGATIPAGGTEVLLLRCDVGCVAGVLRDLKSASGEPLVVRDDAGRAALVRTTREALNGLVPADLEEAARGLPDAPRRGWLGSRRVLALDFATLSIAPADGEAGRVRAERELLATLDNPRDGFFDGLVNRHLSRPLSHLLMGFPVTPNQVTVLGLLLSLVGAGAIALPGIAWPVLGALLLQLTAVLDCVDGEIARAKVLESEWGEWLDITSDTLIHVATFLGIAVHSWADLGRQTAWVLGALFAFGGLASFVVVTRAEKSEHLWKDQPKWQARLLATLLATLTTRDLSVLVLFVALADLLPQLLVGAALGAQVFWIGTLALHTRLMRDLA